MSRNAARTFRLVQRPAAVLLAVVSILAIISPKVGAKNASSGELIVRRSSSQASPHNTSTADRARGRVLTGLVPGGSSCPGGWAVRDVPGVCTHGPDSAPAGVDVTEQRTTEELVATTDEGAASSTSGTASVPCYGDGGSGKRVQVVYAHASDVADRFGVLEPSLVAWTSNVDRTFNDSAAETGGLRHVRWATDSSCKLVIQRVKLSTTGDDAYGNTVSELQSVGLNRADRKYLVWVDSNVYCGVASFISDDSASLTNANNTGSGYGRIDNGCWGNGNSAEAHELMHLLGGVQLSAPHSTGGGHCTDEYDQMCYGDGSNVTMTYPCNSLPRDRLFDCNHDDYYSTSPPAGSYLATHWNTASSSFLAPAAPDAWSPTTTTSPSPSVSPSPTPTSAPSPSTSTVTFSGSLNRKALSRTFSIGVGTGQLNASLKFNKAKSLSLSLLRPDGSMVVSQSGGSPVQLSGSVSGGTYSLSVNGSSNASFTLTVTYPSP